MQLTTERLILREFTQNDWPALFAYQSNPRYQQYYPQVKRSQLEVMQFVEKLILWQNEDPRTKFQLAIVLKSERRLIGTVGVRKHKDTDQQAEVGYEINPIYWGRGYATEAGRAMLAFGFRDLQLHRLWAACIAENTASSRVLEKLGFIREGQLRENQYFRDRWWDTFIYSMLEHEAHL